MGIFTAITGIFTITQITGKNDEKPTRSYKI